MDVDLRGAQVLGQVEQAEEVLDVAVHAAGALQAHEVNRLARVDGLLHVANEHVVLLHGAVEDGLGDQGQLLIDDAARADVGVADLAVAHLAVGQADRHAGGVDERVRAAGKQRVKVRLVGHGDGVALGGLRHAVAVHDAKQNGFLGHGITPSFQTQDPVEDLIRHSLF